MEETPWFVHKIYNGPLIPPYVSYTYQDTFKAFVTMWLLNNLANPVALPVIHILSKLTVTGKILTLFLPLIPGEKKSKIPILISYYFSMNFSIFFLME